MCSPDETAIRNNRSDAGMPRYVQHNEYPSPSSCRTIRSSLHGQPLTLTSHAGQYERCRQSTAATEHFNSTSNRMPFLNNLSNPSLPPAGLSYLFGQNQSPPQFMKFPADYGSSNQSRVKNPPSGKSNGKQPGTGRSTKPPSKSNPQHPPVGMTTITSTGNDLDPINRTSQSEANALTDLQTPRPFKCCHCIKSFKSKALLDQHMHIHYPPKYTCRYCAKKYRWPPVFYHHQRTCKKRPPATSTSTEGTTTVSTASMSVAGVEHSGNLSGEHFRSTADSRLPTVAGRDLYPGHQSGPRPPPSNAEQRMSQQPHLSNKLSRSAATSSVNNPRQPPRSTYTVSSHGGPFPTSFGLPPLGLPTLPHQSSERKIPTHFEQHDHGHTLRQSYDRFDPDHHYSPMTPSSLPYDVNHTNANNLASDLVSALSQYCQLPFKLPIQPPSLQHIPPPLGFDPNANGYNQLTPTQPSHWLQAHPALSNGAQDEAATRRPDSWMSSASANPDLIPSTSVACPSTAMPTKSLNCICGGSFLNLPMYITHLTQCGLLRQLFCPPQSSQPVDLPLPTLNNLTASNSIFELPQLQNLQLRGLSGDIRTVNPSSSPSAVLPAKNMASDSESPISQENGQYARYEHIGRPTSDVTDFSLVNRLMRNDTDTKMDTDQLGSGKMKTGIFKSEMSNAENGSEGGHSSTSISSTSTPVKREHGWSADSSSSSSKRAKADNPPTGSSPTNRLVRSKLDAVDHNKINDSDVMDTDVTGMVASVDLERQFADSSPGLLKSPVSPGDPDSGRDSFGAGTTPAAGRSGKSPQSCHQCGKEFGSRPSLKQHVEGKHGTENRYQCSSCAKQYRWGASYYYHRKSCHAAPPANDVDDDDDKSRRYPVDGQTTIHPSDAELMLTKAESNEDGVSMEAGRRAVPDDRFRLQASAMDQY